MPDAGAASDTIMNLWFRLLHLIVSSLFRPRLDPTRDASALRFRVWPHDLDTSLHLNNGRYWTLMDLGRSDLMIRSGLWRAVLKNGWTPVVSAGTIRFRRELRPFQAFRLETRIVTWAETWVVMEHRMVSRSENGRDLVNAVALVRAGLYDRKARHFIPVERMFSAIGTSALAPEPTPEVAAFLAAEEAMKQGA
jgi:acyl-CoA thioesterase FadM